MTFRNVITEYEDIQGDLKFINLSIDFHSSDVENLTKLF